MHVVILALAGLQLGVAAQATAQHVSALESDGFDRVCIGSGCNAGSGNYRPLRIADSNPSIYFEDRSIPHSDQSTASWAIEINDSPLVGRSNHFSIRYLESVGTTEWNILRVDAAAPENSVRILPSGHIGFGTASPQMHLHAINGSTPGLRLEQDGSDGRNPRIWDIAGNESNFFVRDVMNGSALPLRVRAGAPSNALDIQSTGDVFMDAGRLRLNSASAQLSIGGSDQDSIDDRLHIRDDSGGWYGFRFEDTSGTGDIWRIATNPFHDRFTITKDGTGRAEFLIDGATGNLVVKGALITEGTLCGNGCDRVFEPGHDIPSIEDHATAMWTHGYLPNVGPTPENEPVNVTDKVGRMLNELETAHIYIAELHGNLEDADQDIASLSAELTSTRALVMELADRLEAIEAQASH